ncbi:SusE domain-containing protein [Hymenobacter psychrotolerans]|uniref:SusE outer membrane protein n=1 Tax=Hymenobacter psychrotolerans DSM 18569 TaxID=1121959 RepID=A0A1M6VCE7_9BACT|nr:SusE domain-containing protein [Hymenobacter psychrotolerans]SHK79119.1 SusE outer membrane protein [Hymenobacter psychrotolerans DSM 18569]
MKNWRTLVLGICAASLFSLSACEKDEDRLVLTPTTTGSALQVSSNTIVLDKATPDAPAATFSWKAQDYGYQASPTYILQFIKAGGSFDSVKTVQSAEVTGATSRTFSTADLNGILLRLGLAANTPGQFQARVVSGVRGLGIDTSKPLLSQSVSDPITMTGTPFGMSVLYVPGNYQGWSPAGAPILGAFNSASPQAYEGYIYMSEATPEFKFTSKAGWDGTNYGSGAGAGTLSSAGSAGNLSITTGAGFYLIKADLANMSWSATKTTWAVIGDATPGGWNTETPLTYDVANKVWTGRVALGAGALKFRANNDWTINFGDTGNDGSLEYGGTDIPAPAAGTYTITLNLNTPGSYTYTLAR